MSDFKSTLPVTDSSDGAVSAGSAASFSTLIGVQYNSTVPSVTTGEQIAAQCDTRGALQVTHLDGMRATYSAAKLGLTPQGSDIFTITGSATKLIRVTRIEVSFTQSIYNNDDILLIKRSAANTGGSSTSVPSVPHDSNSAAATATILCYTSNPTLGAAIGNIRTAKLFGQAVNEPYAGSTILVWDFGNRPGQAVVLRGISQVLAINLNSVTISGASFDISIEWTEE